MYLTLDKSIENRSFDIIDKYVIISQCDLEGNITNVSEAFCKISGYSKEELVGSTYSMLRHPDISLKVYDDLWDTIRAGKVWKGELKNRSKKGKIFWLHITIEPFYDEDNQIAGYTSFSQNITERKELEYQHSIIIQQSKSAAMGEMISMIAHQWRQPLQAVSLLAQKIPITKMLENKLDDEFIEETVSEIMSQLKYMSDTVDDFRDFFKPDKEKEKILINEVLDHTLDFLSYMIKVDSIELTVDIKGEVELNIFVNEIVQVLINVIKNARDILVEKNDAENRALSIKSYKEDRYCIIEIQDNGGGIDDTIINKIFEAYFSTKSNKNGTGLGLYMAKTIVENHCHGNIFAQNKDDGALFTISLPLLQEQ